MWIIIFCGTEPNKVNKCKNTNIYSKQLNGMYLLNRIWGYTYIHTYIHTVREEDRHTHRLTIYEKRLYKNSTSKIVQTQLDEYDCTETNTQTAYEILGKKAWHLKSYIWTLKHIYLKANNIMRLLSYRLKGMRDREKANERTGLKAKAWHDRSDFNARTAMQNYREKKSYQTSFLLRR